MTAESSAPIREAITRDVVLSHAADLLMAKGIANFRLKDLATSLGVTMPNLYRYFNSREDIVAQTFLYAYQKQCHHEIERYQVPPTPWESVVEFFEYLRGVVSDTGDGKYARMLRLQALAATSYDEITAVQIAELAKRQHEGVANLFRAAQQQRLFSDGLDANVLAFIVLSTRFGYIFADFKGGVKINDADIWTLYGAAFSMLAEHH